LQILIYYDNRWRLLLKQFICLIFTLGRLFAQLQCGLFQGCETVVKMTQLWLRSSYFHKHGSGLCSISHINILIVLVCLKLNRK